ncbi:MAG: hypothetical protein ACYCU8_00115 [Ferrimicrobium acidiphilum]
MAVLLSKYAIFIYGAGVLLLLGGIWGAMELWGDLFKSQKSVAEDSLASLSRTKVATPWAKVAGKDWIFIIVVAVLTAVLTRNPVMTIGGAVIMFLTRAFFGRDPMELQVETMEANIAWMQTLSFLLQTSRTAWESLMLSAKSLPDDAAKDLRENLQHATVSIQGYVIRLRDALTLFAIKRADPQVDVVVAMVNANFTSSGGDADYVVMQQIQEQMKAELLERNAAISARREIFTIAKLMFPAVAIMQPFLAVLMGNFVMPYYQNATGEILLVFIEAVSVGLIFLFKKFSTPLAETRLIVPQTFLEKISAKMDAANAQPEGSTI